MYKVLKHFTDLQDNNFKYNAGDTFPRKGLKVSAERLNELLTSNNRRNEPMICEVEDEPKASKPKAEPKKKAVKNGKDTKRNTKRN